VYLRALLLFYITFALLLGIPGVAIVSASDYGDSATSLRALWTQDLAAGIAPGRLAPLQAELDASTASTFVTLPAIAFNPIRSRSEISSLRARSVTIYNSDLAAARIDAFTARDTLTHALTPISVIQAHLLREDLAAAQTPVDYSSLAAAWQLDALLVPLDRSLATHEGTLNALIAQANSLSLPSADATALSLDVNTYFQNDPTTRYATATGLLERFDPITISLQTQIDTEVAADAAAQSTALYLTQAGIYTDCKGRALVAPGLSQDTCVSTSIYLLAHKWSTGRLFFALHVGSILAFRGRFYTVYSITQVAQRNWRLADQTAPLTLQTCWTDSGSVWLIIRAR
jgi:hypothetical protein